MSNKKLMKWGYFIDIRGQKEYFLNIKKRDEFGYYRYN